MASLQVIVLGCTGGPGESNLSSYLLVDSEKKESIALDAGTILYGITEAYKKNSLKDFPLEDPLYSPVGTFYRNHIKAYLLSHIHLDHILGLVTSSPGDTHKPILAMDATIDYLRDHIFNGKVWANFGSEGEKPYSIYTYNRLKTGKRSPISQTRMSVEPFVLNHSQALQSSAFLIDCMGDYVLYFGDTSSDFVEKEKYNALVWKKVAPLVKEKKLKAIFIECSYPNLPEGQPLYGHLTPQLLLQELKNLSSLSEASIKGLKVIVTHRKESLKKGESIKEKIVGELLQGNHLSVDFIFPTQGDLISL